jgi:hypothetical protein
MIESIAFELNMYGLIVSPNDDITTFASLSFCCTTFWPTIGGFCSLMYGAMLLEFLF